MNYQDWLIAVDFELKTHFRGVAVADLDDAALANAFASGVSAAAFAMRNPLPTKLSPGALAQPAGPPVSAAGPSRAPWTIAAIALTLLLVASGLAIWLGSQDSGLRRELAKKDEQLAQARAEAARASAALGESEGRRVASQNQASVEKATDLASASLDRSQVIADYESLRTQYNDLVVRFNTLLDHDSALVDEYNSLESQYNMLVTDYNMLLMSH